MSDSCYCPIVPDKMSYNMFGLGHSVLFLKSEGTALPQIQIYGSYIKSVY